MKKLIQKIIHFVDLEKLIRFSAVGVLNTVVDFGIFYVLNTLLQVNAYASQILSFLAATLNSFLCNKYWTFGKKNPINSREIFRYVVAQGSYLLLSLGVMWIFKEKAGLPPMLAKILTAGLMIPYNYILDKIWVFH